MTKDSSLAQTNLNQWLSSINSLLGEASSLEIKTTVVEEILPEVFLPYEAYQAIYQISPTFLMESGVHPSLRDRYLKLRRQLELQYALLLLDPQTYEPDPQTVAAVSQDLPALANHETSWEDLPCRLPPPTASNLANSGLADLLAQPIFTTVLRQLSEVKTVLDQRNQHLIRPESTPPDPAITYIQTSIRLDGQINNRYATQIIDHPQQAKIINLHQQGLAAGEKQWQRLLRFVTEIVRRQQ